MRPPEATHLQHRFQTLIAQMGGTGDATSASAELLCAWGDASRTYHGTGHLLDCLARLEDLVDWPGDHAAIEAALWYHDAVYDARATDSEERSAAWAHRTLSELAVAPALIDEVVRLVLLTRHAEPATDPAGCAVCDIDLSILGRSAGVYESYESAIRQEYAWLSPEAYRVGRRRVLGGLQARDRIYCTDGFRWRYEAAARRNLRHALQRLAGPSG